MRISDWSSDVCSSDLGSSWHGCRLDKTCLNDAVLSNAHFSDCRGTGATLRAARLDHTWMQNVEWRDCDFHGADLTRLAALDSAFRACAMQAAVIAEAWLRSEEHTSELQSLMRTSYAVFCLIKKNITQKKPTTTHNN